MDPVTHAASGAVAILALPHRPATLWALPLAALACASPDIDLLFIHTPLEFLQLHRGITHSLAGAPVMGFLLALLSCSLWRKTTPDHWRFPIVWLFCSAMILLHIWLDIVTTYGTMIFLPFSHYRVRLNSLFIIDILVTLPLLWAILRWRYKRKLIVAVLAWTFLYPAAGIAMNRLHTWQWEQRPLDEGKPARELVVLPDMFAPFFWRVLYREHTEEGPIIQEQGLDFLGRPRTPVRSHPAAPIPLVRKISLDSLAGSTFFDFAILPVMKSVPPTDLPDAPIPNSKLLMFHDLRFGSCISWVEELLALRPNADLPFILMAEMIPDPNLDPDGMTVGRIRLRFSDSGRDSQWRRPTPPTRPNFLEWLVGTN